LENSLHGAEGEEKLHKYVQESIKPSQYPLPQLMERRLEILRALPFAVLIDHSLNPFFKGIHPASEVAPEAYQHVLRPSGAQGEVEKPGAHHAGSVAESDQTGLGLAYHEVSYPIIQSGGSLSEPGSFSLRRWSASDRGEDVCRRFQQACFATRSFLCLGVPLHDPCFTELRTESIKLLGVSGPPLVYSVVANGLSSLQADALLEKKRTVVLNQHQDKDQEQSLDAVLEALLGAWQATQASLDEDVLVEEDARSHAGEEEPEENPGKEGDIGEEGDKGEGCEAVPSEDPAVKAAAYEKTIAKLERYCAARIES